MRAVNGGGRPLFRFVLTALNRLRRLLGGGRGRGVLAIAVTPECRLVLVRLTYARGWRLPGGGVGRDEEPRAAALRELGEEIGMTGHGAVTCVDEVDPKGSTLFLVRDVRYAARRSLEIEEVGDFAPDALPAGATPLTRRKIAEALPLLRRA